MRRPLLRSTLTRSLAAGTRFRAVRSFSENNCGVATSGDQGVTLSRSVSHKWGCELTSAEFFPFPVRHFRDQR